MSGFDNETMYANNYDFRGVQPVVAQVTTAGQLPIGTGASPAIEVGSLTSPDGSIDIGYSSPNITLQADGSIADSFPTDDGTATPNSGVLKILGSSSTDYTQSGLVTHSDGTANEIYIENRLWQTKFVVDSSATVGDRGSYQTISAATAAASSGDTIWIRAGTYTENFTAKAGVTYIGMDTIAGQNQAEIVGKVTCSESGATWFSNISFMTNGDYAISCSGSNSTNPIFYNCGFTGTNYTIIEFSNSQSTSRITIDKSQMDLTTTGIAHFAMSSPGALAISYTIASNSGGSTTSSTQSAGIFYFDYSAILAPYTNSGSTAAINGQYGLFNTAAQHVCPFNQNSTNTIDSRLANCYFESGNAECIAIGAGAQIRVQGTNMYTNGSNLTTGAGTLLYTGITSLTDDSAILNNTTKTALTLLPYAQSAAAESGSVRGTASFDSSDFSVSNGFVTLNGTGAGQTITGDSGGSLAPTSGNWNILGGNGIITSGSGSTLTVTTNGFPTTQVFASGTGATYTTPANCKWIRVRMVGGGGGGAGTGTAGTGNGGNGTASTWSGGSLSAGGGSGGTTTVGGGGGTPSNGDVNIFGGTGGPRWANAIAAIGGYGACSYFGGGGVAGEANGGAGGAGTGYGSGGGGGGSTAVTNGSGAGGGAGAYLEKIITSPAASYTYTVGAAGSAGTAGTSGVAGGAGAPGYIIVEEYYI